MRGGLRNSASSTGVPTRVRPPTATRGSAARGPAYERLIVAVLASTRARSPSTSRGDWRSTTGALSAFAALLLVNFTAAVLIRQQTVLNALFGLAGRGSQTWPLWLRWGVSKVHHVGGIHAGAALAGTAWLSRSPARPSAPRRRDDPPLVPGRSSRSRARRRRRRARRCARHAHNVFELTHRFGGWTRDRALLGADRSTLANGPAADWHVWVLALSTASVASPWLRLRRVPVTVERLSSPRGRRAPGLRRHARVRLSGRISRSPLREWHAFATVSTPGETGFRLLISRAGDWTGRFIDDPPTHVWVRGGRSRADGEDRAALRARRLRRHRQRDRARARAAPRRPRARPPRLVDARPARHVRRRAGRRGRGRAAGRPDLGHDPAREAGSPALTRQAVRDFDAEAVFVVSNQSATLRLVAELEAHGIPAFGPIWDS